MKSWGFLFLRFLISWEAIEHGGPYVTSAPRLAPLSVSPGRAPRRLTRYRGIYDDEYIDYVVDVLTVAQRHGFKVFLDPHQDCWSRVRPSSPKTSQTPFAPAFARTPRPSPSLPSYVCPKSSLAGRGRPGGRWRLPA